MMRIKYFFKDCPFSFTGSFQSCIFFSFCALLHSLSAVGECADENKRHRRMRGMKLCAIGEGMYSEIKCYRRRCAMNISSVGEDAEWK